MRLVVVQGEQEPVDGTLFTEFRFPATRAGCEPCPTCQEWRDSGKTVLRRELLDCGHTNREAVLHSRPCLFARCSMNTYLDPVDGQSIRFNWPDREIGEMGNNCALDAADRGGMTLEEVGEHMNLTRERVRQLIEGALKHGRKVTNSMFKHHIDVEDPNSMPDPRHPLSDVE